MNDKDTPMVLITVCTRCKGKGHVYDSATGLFVPIYGWILSFLEKNDSDPGALTRKRCPPV